MQIIPELQKANIASIHPIVEKILLSRGLKTNEIPEFFSWDLKNIPDLTQMLDMDKTSDRIIKAINGQELIGIFGDYDVDGTTSCALFYHFFQMLDVEVKLYQPSRFVEGYGIHPSSIDQAVKDNCKVLITVDCGISNLETADYAKNFNIDLIITDHHKDAREHLPHAFSIVNPNRRDENQNSEFKYLAGVGVAFAVCHAVRQKLLKAGQTIPSLYPLLQWVAIGTISDLAYLSPLNLKLVRHGLLGMPNSSYAGVLAFLTPDERALKVIPSEKIAFTIGPMINSKGRLDHPEAALKLLCAKDYHDALGYYRLLENSNLERKRIQAEVFEEVKKQILKNMKEPDMPIHIAYEPHWHEGVIGIVASKIVDTFEVPAIIFTDSHEKGIIKASARTAGALDLFWCLNECKDLFIKFGGHKAAAGLSMPKENLPLLKTRLTNLLKDVPLIERTVQRSFDLMLDFKDINRDLVRALDQMEPFGMGNPRPVFRMQNFKLESYQILKEVHVKWNFISIQKPPTRLGGISFNYIGKWNAKHPEDLIMEGEDGNLTLEFTIGINRFRGNEIIQLMANKIF